MTMTNAITAAIGLTLASLVCLSCKPKDINWVEDDAAPGTAKVVSKAVDPASTRGHMRDHFSRSTALLTAVIDGDLEHVRAESQWLANHELQPSLYPWRGHVEKLREAARPGAAAYDIHSAARVAAQVGAACGECHRLLGSVPVFPNVAVPPATAAPGPRMRLHTWAADRMWEGLIGPSEELWNSGVAALAVAPLRDDEILDSASAAPEIVAQERAVHDLANEGSNATTLPDRVEVYARFLENCSSCHRKVGWARRP